MPDVPKISTLRGMRDLTGEEAKNTSDIISKLSKIASCYGHRFIRLPILEETEVFTRTAGASSDIVSKEMYTFTTSGPHESPKSITMRPEGTAGAVRYFIERKMDRQSEPQKLFYSGSMFRRERPQYGRYREFTQFGVESFVDNSAAADVSMVLMADDMIKQLDLRPVFHVNYIGCSQCREKYTKKLVAFLESKVDNLCSDCQRRLEANSLRVLDCKLITCNWEIEGFPEIMDSLCKPCSQNSDEIFKLLKDSNLDINIEIHPEMVRGLDYYNGFVFEILAEDSTEFTSQSIGAGGRYNDLVSTMGGKPTSALGFALGVDRIVNMYSRILDKKSRPGSGIYFGILSDRALPHMISLSAAVRGNIRTKVEYTKRGIATHFKKAEAFSARYILLIGEDELTTSIYNVKSLKTGEVFKLDKAGLIELLKLNPNRYYQEPTDAGDLAKLIVQKTVPIFRGESIEEDTLGLKIQGDFSFSVLNPMDKAAPSTFNFTIWTRDFAEQAIASYNINIQTLEISFDGGESFQPYSETSGVINAGRV